MIIIKDKKELFDVLNEWEASKVSIKKNEIKDPEEIYFTHNRLYRKILEKCFGYLFGYPKNRNPRLTWVSSAKSYPEPESNRHECYLIGF